MKKKAMAAMLVAALVGLPALAQMQQVLSIVVNGVALQGKALNYKGRVYVAVEDLAQATGGRYSYDPNTKLLQATIPTPAGAPRSQASPGERAYLKVVSEKKYLYADNAIVVATIRNPSRAPARNLEISCHFRGDGLKELGQSVKRLPVLPPGQEATLEFRLYEQAGNLPPGPAQPVVFNGNLNSISYNLKMNYQ